MGHYASEMDPSWEKPSVAEQKLSEVEDEKIRALAKALLLGFDSSAHIDTLNAGHAVRAAGLIDELVRIRVREALQDNSVEKRVFGEAFSFKNGRADDDICQVYFEDRMVRLQNGETVWVARNLDSDTGVVADLYSERKVVATVDYDYDTFSTDAYYTDGDESFGNVLLCHQVSFEEAVKLAEQHAASQAP